jgi:FKBP-type peptidyl-prolyl cis-trans isomerase FkpA
MSRVIALLVAGSQAIAVHAQAPPPGPAPRADGPPSPSATGPVAAFTDEQKTIYALGLLMQRSVRQFDLSIDEIEILRRAMVDAAANTPAVDLRDWGPRIEPLATARGLRATAREKAAGAAYVAAAAAEAGAIQTPSGLVYRDLVPGVGASPTAADTVRVNYRGTLIDGTEFDRSAGQEPAAFRLNGVVPCWTEGVQRMRVGGTARLVCPSELAYGDTGSPTIPGGAALIFEVELVDIVRAPAPR